MSLGFVGDVATPTAMKFLFISLTVSTCAPFVTCRISPLSETKYRLREPSFSTLKYTPLASGAHIMPLGERSSFSVSARAFRPSASITYIVASFHVASVLS